MCGLQMAELRRSQRHGIIAGAGLGFGLANQSGEGCYDV